MTDWDRLVETHAGAVFRIAYRILGSVADAEDVAQEVFCEAFRIQHTQTVASWAGLLRRLAALRAIDHLRRSHRPVPLDPEEPTDQSGPLKEATARELADRLRSAVGQLPAHQATVFSLMYFEQLSRREIARALEISPAAVSTALFKARQKLQVLLKITEENYHG